ncbi:MAG: YkgJ family cysteine cluster protein [Candidatus Thorarchaeota archaeon]|nr:MAG: YkgJ family cysteine cluster protein [Candidatus Thorarchaeota archaeon]
MLCCTDTEMTLTRKDIDRIEVEGYSREDFLQRTEDGFCELRNVDGLCYFYDPSNQTCRIYETRPDGCRFYPIVYDMKKRKCVVDADCPSRSTISRDEIRKVCHKVRSLVETLVREARNGESPC